MLLFIFLTSIVITQTAPLIKWCIKKQNKDDGNQGLGYSQKQPFKKHVEVWLRVACLLACLLACAEFGVQPPGPKRPTPAVGASTKFGPLPGVVVPFPGKHLFLNHDT